MKKLIGIITILLLVGLGSCIEERVDENYIGVTSYWKVYKVNDTVAICVPRNSDRDPVVINLKSVPPSKK